MKHAVYIILSLLLTTLCFCSLAAYSEKNDSESETIKSSSSPVAKVGVQRFPAKPNSIYDVVKDIDLKGLTYRISEGVTIRQKGGVIKNGTLIGNNTKIISKTVIFDKVSIQGTWVVENISTNLFKDLTYINSLRDVMALVNPNIKNSVRIEKGNYFIKLSNNNKTGITVPSKTNLIIDGNIKLVPNNLENYIIVDAKGNEITISGKGSIIGDKENHTGSTGEWGMGIFVNGKNIHIRSITIKDCWGDCIYVGNKSKNVYIDNCLMDNGRRQGISITCARNVYVMNCVIRNVHGTAPQYAIDIEPNQGDTVVNVFIQNIQIQNCVGGITAYGGAKNAYLSGLFIYDCTVDEKVKHNSFQFYKLDKMVLKNCTAKNDKRKIIFDHINNLETRRNTVNGRMNMETYTSCKNVNGRKQLFSF